MYVTLLSNPGHEFSFKCFRKLFFPPTFLAGLCNLETWDCCVVGAQGDKAADEKPEKHEEAKEKLSTPEKPEDITAPSTIREYNSLNWGCAEWRSSNYWATSLCKAQDVAYCYQCPRSVCLFITTMTRHGTGSLGHQVNCHLDHLSHPGHRVIMLTWCKSRVFQFSKKSPR